MFSRHVVAKKCLGVNAKFLPKIWKSQQIRRQICQVGNTVWESGKERQGFKGDWLNYLSHNAKPVVKKAVQREEPSVLFLFYSVNLKMPLSSDKNAMLAASTLIYLAAASVYNS